jgi:sporulation protein YlmC with PRC-barrel domain/Cu/Ag efflux protein CusF
MQFTRLWSIVAVLGLLCTTTVSAAQQRADEPGMTSRLHRASEMIGTEVENPQGENLGKIEEIVIDPVDNSVAYAVLSFGGFLGLGEKYFAIPWRALQHRGEGGETVVLDVDKERLENAPGFNKNDWPDMANRSWGEEIHAYYGQQPYWERRAGMQSTGAGQQTMTQAAGQQPHDAVSATVETIDQNSRQLTLMTADGNTVEFKAPEALLQDLQTGDSVQVMIRKKEDHQSQQTGQDKKSGN